MLLSGDGQDSIHTERLKGFLHVGFHGRDSEMRDSGDFLLVDDVSYGQFDLNWCSIKCLRTALGQLLDDLETRISQQTPGEDEHQE